VQGHADSGGFHFERFGDLVVGKLFKVPQEEDGCFVLAQLLQ